MRSLPSDDRTYSLWIQIFSMHLELGLFIEKFGYRCKQKAQLTAHSLFQASAV